MGIKLYPVRLLFWKTGSIFTFLLHRQPRAKRCCGCSGYRELGTLSLRNSVLMRASSSLRLLFGVVGIKLYLVHLSKPDL